MRIKEYLQKIPLVGQIIGDNRFELPGYVKIYRNQPEEEELERR